MREPLNTPRDIARELARKYSTMTHEELDELEKYSGSVKFSKGEMILEGRRGLREHLLHR